MRIEKKMICNRILITKGIHYIFRNSIFKDNNKLFKALFNNNSSVMVAHLKGILSFNFYSCCLGLYDCVFEWLSIAKKILNNRRESLMK